MRIQIEYNNQTQEIEVDSNDTVQAVINMYSKINKKRPNNMSLKYQGEPLSENRRLKELGIHDDCTLNAYWRIQGGNFKGIALKFLDVAKGKMEKHEVTEGPPCNLSIERGLNLHGICSNKSCKAYNEIVICPIKEKEFDFTQRSNDVICPICDMLFHPTNCGFYKCKYYFLGKKYYEKDEKIETIKKVDKFTQNGFYETFDELATEEVTWLSLKVFVDISKEKDNEGKPL